MKQICRIVAGSRLYGLDTPDSDIDTRGVFLNDDPGEILGMSRGDVMKESSSDALFIEFRHYLGHLRKSNTSSIELLFADGFDLMTEEFEVVRENRNRLMDCKRFFSSLLGYIHNERRLANGERTGDIGSKRRVQLEQFGFSPKNFSHMLRLSYCGEVFFRESIFPVCLHGHPIRDLIFSVKTKPENFTRDRLNLIADEAVGRLKDAYECRKNDYSFDVDFANSLCLRFYLPFLKD